MGFKISKQMCKDLEAFYFKRLHDPSLQTDLEFNQQDLKFVEAPLKNQGDVVKEEEEAE